MFDSSTFLGLERPTKLVGIEQYRYVLASKYVTNKSVLDLGCGLGLGTHYLTKFHPQAVLGIDISKQAIKYSLKHHQTPLTNYIALDCLSLNELKMQFDLIIAFEVIEHLSYHQGVQLIKLIKQSLAPKGILLLSTPNRLITSSARGVPRNPYHLYEYSPINLKQTLHQHFNRIDVYGIKCVNTPYTQLKRKLESSLKYQIINYVCQYKLTHFLLPMIPAALKNKFTGRNNLHKLSISDYKLTFSNIQKLEYLFAVCR